MYKYILIIISFLCSFNLNQWDNLVPKLSPQKIIKHNDNIVVNLNGSLMLYNHYSKVFIDYDSINSEACLQVSDFGIDLNNELWILCSDGSLFKENSNLGINHLIDIDNAYDLSFTDDSVFFLYETENYGIVELVYNDNEIFFKDYYYGFSSPDVAFIKLITLNNSIYVLTSEGVYYASLDTNLKNFSSWNLVSFTDDVVDMLIHGSSIVLISDSEIRFLNNESNQIANFFSYENIGSPSGEFITSFSNSNLNDRVYILGDQRLFSIDINGNIENWYTTNTINLTNAQSLFVDESNIYIGIKNQGFSIIGDYEIDNLTEVSQCSPNTFIQNKEGFPIVEALTYSEGKLYGVSRDGIFIYDEENFINLISNTSRHSYLELQNSDDCNHFIANQLDYVPGDKISSSIVLHNNKIYVPNSGISPSESNNRGGLVIVDLSNFEDMVIGESYLDGQSGIYNTPWDSNYMVVNQVKFDNYGRVWIVNPYAENEPYEILTYYEPENDTWGHIQAPDQVSYLPQEIAFDNLGRLWVAFQYEQQLDGGGDYSNGGIKIVTRSGYWLDVDNLESLPSTSNGANSSVWSLDFGKFEGNDILWVLTSNGVQGYSISGTRIDPIYPIDFFTNIQFQEGDKVRVDSQNNVWIITGHSGARVIKNDISFWPSEAGITTDNSDILSNVITDIAFDNENGQAFLSTDKGISVLEIPFTTNKENTNVGLSPNPFVIGESDYITIEDMYSGSIIKIMTLSGNVVKKIELPYNENRINWDGRNNNGELLDTGVYLVVVENNQYGNGVSKIAIIR